MLLIYSSDCCTHSSLTNKYNNINIIILTSLIIICTYSSNYGVWFYNLFLLNNCICELFSNIKKYINRDTKETINQISFWIILYFIILYYYNTCIKGEHYQLL